MNAHINERSILQRGDIHAKTRKKKRSAEERRSRRGHGLGTWVVEIKSLVLFDNVTVTLDGLPQRFLS